MGPSAEYEQKEKTDVTTSTNSLILGTCVKRLEETLNKLLAGQREKDHRVEQLKNEVTSIGPLKKKYKNLKAEKVAKDGVIRKLADQNDKLDERLEDKVTSIALLEKEVESLKTEQNEKNQRVVGLEKEVKNLQTALDEFYCKICFEEK